MQQLACHPVSPPVDDAVSFECSACVRAYSASTCSMAPPATARRPAATQTSDRRPVVCPAVARLFEPTFTLSAAARLARPTVTDYVVTHPAAAQPTSAAEPTVHARQKPAMTFTRPLCVRRRISNATYLRRLYVGTQEADLLFPVLPPLKSNKKHALATTRLRLSVRCADTAGSVWPVACEYTVRNNNIRCRLVDGWARFCRDKAVVVGDCVVMQPGQDAWSVVVVVVREGNG